MKLIIFDMDGTVVNSGTMIANSINYVRKNIGLVELEKDILLENINNPHINPAEFFYGSNHFTENQTELFCQFYEKNCVVGVEIYNGIENLLEELHPDYTLTIATNASSIFANKILNHLKIDKYFTRVIGADMVKNPKPQADMLLKTMDELKIEKSDTILIGDSEKDMISAQKAGIKHILVNWGFSKYDENAVNNVDELKKIVKQNHR